MSDLISVIIPVYNSETSIDTCLASVLSQTYSNYEIILADDGSTDSSSLICDKYAETNTAIKVLHQENAGPSAARNAGLSIAKGDYITFVDSDDEIATNYLESLLDIIKNGSDVAAVSYQIVGKGQSPQLDKSNADLKIFDSKSAVSSLLYQKELDSSQCFKLFRKEILEGIAFPTDIRVYEDLYFIYKVYSRCKKISWAERRLYYYHKEDNGQMDSVSPMVKDAFIVMDRIKGEINQKYPELNKAIDNRTISVSFNILKLLARSGRTNPEVEDICWENIKRYRFSNFFDNNVRLKNKIGVIASLFGKNVLSKCFSIGK